MLQETASAFHLDASDLVTVIDYRRTKRAAVSFSDQQVNPFRQSWLSTENTMLGEPIAGLDNMQQTPMLDMYHTGESSLTCDGCLGFDVAPEMWSNCFASLWSPAGQRNLLDSQGERLLLIYRGKMN